MKRRTALHAALPAALWPLLASAAAIEADAPLRLATAWRVGAAGAGALDADGGGRDRVGVLAVSADGASLRITAEVPLPTRAHGLLAMPDGGFIAVGYRPGRWLLRCDARGAPMRWWRSAGDSEPTLNGHVEASADGQQLFTTETDPATGRGCIAVRDAQTLERVGLIDSFGIDPHHLLRAEGGTLMVANGGIVRDRRGRRMNAERMAPSLVRIDAASASLLGRWQLADAHLSIRHLAWSSSPEPLLGVALQAEHDSAAERATAPVLAIWNGKDGRDGKDGKDAFTMPELDARSRAAVAGYTGDICAGPAGGFVLSAQKQGRVLWWHPADAERLTLIAELTDPCALFSSDAGRGVQIGAGRGLALWHAAKPSRMLAWPVPLAPDNHAIALRGS